MHRAPSRVSLFTQQAPVECLLCACGVLGAGPTEVKERSGPCPHGTSVLERETEPSNVVTAPGTCQAGPPCCPGPRSQLRAPRALSLACLRLLSPQHSPHSWASFSGVPPITETSEDSSLCVSSGTVPAPRFCFSQVSSGRNGLRQSPVTAVPGPCQSPAKASFTAWCRHHAGRSQEAMEWETRHCIPRNWTWVASHHLEPACSPVGRPAGLDQCSKRNHHCCYAPGLPTTLWWGGGGLVPNLQMRRARPSIVQSFAKSCS